MLYENQTTIATNFWMALYHETCDFANSKDGLGKVNAISKKKTGWWILH